MIRKLFYSRLISSGIFYGWNTLFIILLITLEVEVHGFADLLDGIFSGYTPVTYLWYVLLMVLTPVSAFLIGLRYLSRKPEMMLSYFYGVEIPIYVLLIFRLFAFHEMTWPIAAWYLIFGLAIASHVIDLWPPKWIKSSWKQGVNVFRVLVGAASAIIILIYAFPIVVIVLKELEIPDWDSWHLLEMTFLGVIAFLFVVLSGTLFILAPFMMTVYYCLQGIKTWLESDARWELRYGAAGAGLACFVFLAFPRQQPQIEAFDYCEAWVAGEMNDREMLEERAALEDGLVNAYVWDYRYIWNNSDVEVVTELYDEAFGVEPAWLQSTVNAIFSPFFYDGERFDEERAAEFYEQVFDEPIERAEKDRIVDAMKYTFNWPRVAAGILAVDQKQVEVTHRDVNYDPTVGDGFVRVSFHERYLNRTYDAQEVFYYFSLPERSVVTGLWLSDDDANLLKYPANVSPRGAAQEVYVALRQARQDPALLEQVGPAQYRLRVFPIEPRWAWHRLRRQHPDEPEKPMHITLELLCKVDEGGKIALPQLTEKRNVYWDGDLESFDADEWFPSEAPVFADVQHVTAGDLAGVHVTEIAPEDLPEEKRQPLHVLIDGSYSMSAWSADVSAFCRSWPDAHLWILHHHGVEPLLSADEKDSAWYFYGSNYPMNHLTSWSETLTEGKIVWLTDHGNYELLEEGTAAQSVGLARPLDIVHVGTYAPIYEDAFLETCIRSGGSVYGSTEEWSLWQGKDLSRYPLSHREPGALLVFTPDSNTSDTALASDVVSAASTNAYYASRYAMAIYRTFDDVSPDTLDRLHDLALQYRFVSPFSSMICLVNDAQQQMLSEAEAEIDRYDREVETGKISGNSTVSASPEPHEWALLLVAALLMAYLYRDRLIAQWRRI